MNAEDAKKLAAANKKQAEEKLKLREEKVIKVDVSLLYKHLSEKVEESVHKGKLSTDEIQFPADRFDVNVIREVADLFKEEGYSFELKKHNAYNKLGFVISWA